MFACCVAGRPLQTNFQQIDDTRIVFQLTSASTINHICVFLLGTIPFPDGYGATVHLFWPGKGFQLLGMLSNDKPSAIFRLRGTFIPNTTTNAHDAFTLGLSGPDANNDVTVALGISIEPLAQIQPQLMALSPVDAKPVSDFTKDPVALVDKIVKHLINYLSGFSDQGITPATINVIANWYQLFVSKVKTRGLEFLRRED